MERVDIDETEAEFIEFEFKDEAAAEAADRLYPFAAHLNGTSRIARLERVSEAREALSAGGAEWTESESSVDEDEMWPEWPGDERDGPDEEEDGPDEEDTSPPGP